ncbi:MAG: hypothetical protein PHI35_07260 [Victivallaceae bacterium]|nr:hypothetical protein [Victivallaceae bacterium]
MKKRGFIIPERGIADYRRAVEFARHASDRPASEPRRRAAAEVLGAFVGVVAEAPSAAGGAGLVRRVAANGDGSWSAEGEAVPAVFLKLI